jgi:tRNA dimethylallyltransferase
VLAAKIGGEIVSADSQQVYRGFDIGTAKPSHEERRGVAHHLIDVADPSEVLSAGEFARRADAAIEQIAGRGAVPVVVGGTGLWIRALLQGLMEAPASDADLRQRLEREAATSGREAMHRRLLDIDPAAAAQIAPENLTRVLRALEIHALTGEAPSRLWARHGFARLRYRAKVLGLSPPRSELYRRIDERCRSMFDRGLIAEVRGLAARGHRSAPAMKAIGYREALCVVDGTVAPEEAIRLASQATRRYAKRQLTWFKKDPLVEWLSWPVQLEGVVAAAQGFLEARPD